MSRFTYLTAEGENNTVEFELTEQEIRLGQQVYPCDGKAVWIEGRRVPFAIARSQGANDLVNVWLDGEVYSFRVHDPRQRARAQGETGIGSGNVTAQMPGKILSLAVSPGDEVKSGQNLLIMESMKMELALNAPADGVVAAVEVAVGQMVAQGEILVSLTCE